MPSAVRTLDLHDAVLAINGGHCRPGCAYCLARARFASRDVRERLADAHFHGKHQEAREVDCTACRTCDAMDIAWFTGSLADYFAPRPVGWVPEGFRR